MKNKKKLGAAFEERKQRFLYDFSREAPAVRESIAQDLPFYNMLLSLRSESFEEIALRQIAKKRNVPYSKDAPPVPDCPYCKTHDSVGRKEKGIYRCRTCERTFSVNHNSICFGSKKQDTLTWLKTIKCLLESASIAQACDLCGYEAETYYKLRNRIVYAMQLLLSEIKLYGEIQADITYVNSSYKGYNLKESEFSDDSIFYDPSFKPREARQRGGAVKPSKDSPDFFISKDSICIFTAIDDRGHVITRFAGIGATNSRALKAYIPDNKYLLEVPKEDPFGDFMKEQNAEPKTVSGDISIMIADKEKAIKKYAESIGLQFESHVYRRNGVQMRTERNIQRANALHKRLKEFLRDNGGVSSKYLPAYLTVFDFLANTDGSDKAIERLIQIIAEPNLSPPRDFFDTLFKVPNYLEIWLEHSNDSPLKKIPYNKILAYYLYDQIRNKEKFKQNASFSVATINDIEDITGYTAPTIRRAYNDLTAAGYRELIISHFMKQEQKQEAQKKRAKEKEEHGNKGRYKKDKTLAPATINPIILAMYDAYVKNKLLPKPPGLKGDEFVEKMNTQFGTNLSRENMLMKFKYIEDRGLRPPRQTLKKEKVVPQQYLDMLEDYKKLRRSYREKGGKIPQALEFYEILAKKYNVSCGNVRAMLAKARKYLREKNK